MARNLYFSFTTLMGGLYRNEISPQDLSSAIFFIARSRDRVMSVEARDEWARTNGHTTDEAARVHGMLVTALTLAEAQGRVRFGMRRYEHLNSLLDSLGLPSIFRTPVYRDQGQKILLTPTFIIEYFYLKEMLAANCPEVVLAEKWQTR